MNIANTVRSWFTPEKDTGRNQESGSVQDEVEDTYGWEFAEEVAQTVDPVKHMRMAYHPDDYVVMLLSGNPNITGPRVWVRFLNHSEELIRRNAILNISLPASLLAEHLERLDPAGNADDAADFAFAQERADLLASAGREPEPELEGLLTDWAE
jgi:hypothetical protein